MSPIAIEIFTLLRRQMNGAVTGSMVCQGVTYGMNYGVSLPTIKDIAQRYAPNHSLAAELWRQEVRELKIAAAYIDDPTLVTAALMQQWSEQWTTVEMAEVCATSLFYLAPDMLATAHQWTCRGNDLQRHAGYMMAGKGAQLYSVAELEKFISVEASAYCLREIFKAHPSLRASISAIASQVADLEWQLEYISE